MKIKYVIWPVLVVATVVILFRIAWWVYPVRFLSGKSVAALTAKGEKGDQEACWCLRQYYRFTQDDEQSDFWLEKGARAGELNALYHYSTSFLKRSNADLAGKAEFKARVEEKLALLKKAADLDHEEAQWKLGHLYWYGKYVRRDLTKGEYWYRRAVNNGSTDAMKELSRNLYSSRNDRESLIEAYMLSVIVGQRLLQGEYKNAAERASEDQEIIRDKMKKLGFDAPALVKMAEARAVAKQKEIPAASRFPSGFKREFFEKCEEYAKK